jgi:ribosomal-protein-alanine N-acetyltransferase
MSAKPQSPHPLIRALRSEDVDRLIHIEESAYPFPWTRGIFADCIRVGYACFGLQLGRDLQGYTVYNWAGGESHLLNLCIHPDWQRLGYGSLLLEHSISHARRRKCLAMFLEVRPSNPAASRIYTQRGFEIVGRRPAYYNAAEGREDAIVMRLSLLPG